MKEDNEQFAAMQGGGGLLGYKLEDGNSVQNIDAPIPLKMDAGSGLY